MSKPTLALAILLSPVLLAATHQAVLAQTEAPTSNSAALTESNRTELLNRGIYWYERYRFDLANQAFNRVLLTNPNQAEALKWRGLIEVRSGNMEAARIWLNKLTAAAGNANPHSRELSQVLSLATNNRQAFAEVRFLVNQTRTTNGCPSLKAFSTPPPWAKQPWITTCC
ncbi:MAG: hypothetical protein HC848_01845 [Limnobacter sp.]|nr:hypothetical protein [Limnobacter sp.]